MKQVCNKCGSDQIEYRAWVSVNGDKVNTDSGNINGSDTWCENCQEHNIDFISEDQFKNNG